LLGSPGPLAGTHHDEVLAARGVVERFLGAVQEYRPLLGGDHLHLEAVRRRDVRKRFVRTEGLPVDDRVGDDDHGAAVIGQESTHLAQAGAHLFLPERRRLVETQTAVATARANFLFLQAAGLESQPAQSVDVVFQVVVDARVGRRGDDQVDRSRLESFHVARVDAGHRGAWRAVPDAFPVRREALGQFARLLDEEPDGKSARQASRCLLAGRIAFRVRHLGQDRRYDQT